MAPTTDDVKWLKNVFDFHDLALEDIFDDDVRPKQETYDEVLFTVFGAININPGEDMLDTINLNIFLTGNYIVTTRTKPLKTVRVARKIIESHPRVLSKGTDYLYYMLLDGVIDRYFDVLDEIEKEIEAVEDSIFGKKPIDVQELIFESKRKLAYLKRSVGPKREALRTLVYADLPQISKETQTHLRDVLDHVKRIDDTLEIYREILNGLMAAYMTQISNRMNEVMKLMSVIATIMLPLSFLAGLFGMNFEKMPGLDWDLGFWILVSFMAVLVGLIFWFFKRSHIL